MTIALIACVSCLAFAPIIGLVAISYRVVSGSAAVRWSQAPKPLLGGISMFLAIMVAMCFGEIPFADHPILSCAGLFTAVGIVDDVFTLSAGKKLAFQFLAAMLSLRFFFLVPFSLTFGIEVIWIVLFVNAFNLIDGLDGLAVSFATIVFLWIAFLGNPHAFSYAILGVCIGFLPYNFRNASLYLGDSGSHFLGSAIAVLVLPSQIGEMGIPSYHLTDLLPLLYPIADILFVAVTRRVRHRSIFAGGTDHIAHRLARLTGEKKAVFILIGITAICIAVSLYSQGNSQQSSNEVVIFTGVLSLLSLIWLEARTRKYFSSSSSPAKRS